MMIKLKWSSFIVLLITLHSTFGNGPTTKEINLNFLEEQQIGTEIYNLKSDFTGSQVSDVTFKLSKQYLYLDNKIIDAKTQWVSLDRISGSLTVNTPLDREMHCGIDETECHIDVHIIETTRAPSIQFIVLHLDITDFNDHKPEFPVHVINVNVSENADVGSYPINLDRYLATDNDIGVNARIHYTISRNNFFGLRESKDETGAPHLELVVASALDHETTPDFYFQLTASDRGQPTRSSEITLNIHIIDENDNGPIFDKSLYVITLPENMDVGADIITLRAHDEDTGIFGQINYFIPSVGNSATAEDLVQINSYSGVVTLKKRLDYDKHNNIRVVIGAKDGNENNFKVGKTILDFRVNDINDNAPIINVLIISDSLGETACISENAPVDTYVAQVITRDADHGKNSEVSVTITSHPVLPSTQQNLQQTEAAFYIAEGDYIKTNSVMDRELFSSYLIRITACDKGEPSLCSKKNLTVKILDENDHAPVFRQVDTNIILPEDTELGTVVTKVSAVDGDNTHTPSFSVGKNGDVGPSLNGEITYTLDGGEGTFVINQQSGKITLVVSLDYEERRAWKLVAVATDGGGKTTNATFIVNIRNVNDHAPRIIKPLVNSTVLTTILRKEPIITVEAEDYDSGSENGMKFFIIEEDGKKEPHIFMIDRNTGVLMLNFSIPDMRTTMGEHSVVIQVEDNGIPPKKTNTSFIIEVTDWEASVIDKHLDDYQGIKKSKINITVIFVASLSAVTIFLILVLAGVVIKCRRENKEIRTYNCRNAESKQGWQLTSSHGSLPDDIVVTSSNHLMASRDSILTWNQKNDPRASYESRVFAKNQTAYSTSNLARPSDVLDQQFSSFSKIPRSNTVSVLPQTQQVDGDSGRGDSDHETQSTEEREPFHKAEIERCVDENTEVVVEMPESDAMGPLCTHLCRQYGHSDACWMHIMENDELYQTNHIQNNSPQRPTTPCYRYYNTNSISSRSGLETICETQPLHSVLGNDPQEYIEPVDEYEESYMNENNCNSYELHMGYMDPQHQHNPDYCHLNNCTETYMHTGSLYHSSQTMPHYSNNQQRHDLSCTRHSASDLFHDGQNPHASPPPRLLPAEVNMSPTYPHSEHNSRSSSPIGQNRRSNGSMYNDLLNRRYLSARQSMASPHQFGQVSMQETQQIIDDIDQLIDH